MTEPEYIMNPDGTVGKIILVSDRTIVGCTFPLSNELGIDIQDVSDVVPTKLSEALTALVPLADAVLDHADKHCRWFDISTAPKDGTNIILGNEVTVAVGKWARDDWRAMYFVREGTGDFQAGAGLLNEPTHWRPLPPPPSNPPLPAVFTQLGQALEKTKGAG